MTKLDKAGQKGQGDEPIRECFDALKMPPELKFATMNYISKQALTKQTATKQVSTKQASTNIEDLGILQSDRINRKDELVFAHRKRSRRLVLVLAACLTLLLLAFGGSRWYSAETAYISIDLNPSLELGVNRFDTVMSARALNEDGQAVLEDVSVVGLSYPEALDEILENEIFLTYIYDDSFIELNIACDSDKQRTFLCELGEYKIETMPCGGICTGADYKLRQEALEEGMGLGRYRASLTLLELDPSLSLDDCKALSMRQLREKIIELDPDSEYAYSAHVYSSKGDSRGKSQEEAEDEKQKGHFQGERAKGTSNRPQHKGKNRV